MRRCLGVLLLLAAPLQAQSTRDSALSLYNHGDHLAALPLLAALYQSSPGDCAVATDYGFALLDAGALGPDLDARKAKRLLARDAFVRAKGLCERSGVVDGLIEALGASGGDDPHFSANAQVDSAMKRADRDYAAGDFPAALAGYHDALLLDPGQYDAALFIGDTYFRMHSIDSALTWYRRAIAINPDRETAHRYMSDVMLKNNQVEDGLREAICAIVVQPFNRLARQGIVQAASTMRVALRVPLVDLPPRDTSSRSAAAAAYDSVHHAWRGNGSSLSAPFAAQFPAESVYRTSLAEEAAALRAAAATADSTATTLNLRHLDADHELEPFIFFIRADQGIASDYPAFRKAHTVELMNFWLKWVVHRP
ncbi:MAG TPA: tetratricopeptide repeat protein [Gemmatimonadales bacterium]